MGAHLSIWFIVATGWLKINVAQLPWKWTARLRNGSTENMAIPLCVIAA